MRESEKVSGRSTGKTAKCRLVRRVSDLGHTANTGAHGKTSVRRVSWIWAHDKLFLFSILNQSMEKNTANIISFHSILETCFAKFNEMYVAKDYQIN